MTRYLLLFFTLLIFVSSAQARTIKTSEELVAAMQKKYAKSWYKTATFVQKTTEFEKDGTSKASTWYEALSMPGRLRIDIEPIKDGNGILFANDTAYFFKDGKLDRSRALLHPLLILGFDIYFLSQEEAINKLKQLKFDLSVMHEDTWQGRPVYVVGAKQGDLKSPQFWIDKDRLYFVRLIQPAGKDGAHIQETQFNKYQKLGGGWIAPEVIFMVDGKTATTEEYSDMHANVALADNLFDPQQWTTATHWRK